MENLPPPPPPPSSPSLSDLPDDLLIMILSKLPVKSRTLFLSFSKSWEPLVSNSHNLLQPAMYGLYYSDLIARELKFFEAKERTPLASVPIDVFATFLPANLQPKLYFADCRNGLLLLNTRKLILICNPATKKWAHIPPPPSGIKKKLLVLAFDPRRSERYHVVACTCQQYGNVLDVFSSATRQWSTIKKFDCFVLCGFTRFGFSGGVLYCMDLVTEDTFAVDVEGRFCWRIMRPVEFDDKIVQHCFGQSGGILHYVTYTHRDWQESTMSVWVLENSRSNQYVLKHRSAYKAVVGGRCDGLANPDAMAFHPHSDVLFMSLQGELLEYHLEGGKVEKIRDIDADGPMYPYSPYLSEDLEL